MEGKEGGMEEGRKEGRKNSISEFYVHKMCLLAL
jgi:hypothetical protein